MLLFAMEKYGFKKEECVINPVIGEYDAPNLQKQGLLTMPISADGNWIIYGMADSGKEDMINALVYSCSSFEFSKIDITKKYLCEIENKQEEYLKINSDYHQLLINPRGMNGLSHLTQE